MAFINVYEDPKRAESYAELEFPGTYYLAYRDLPKILSEAVRGRKALDFGCGTGRSTRFLKGLGFETIGMDIAEDMIKKARERDAHGEYHLVEKGVLSPWKDRTFDLVLSVFTFDNIPTMTEKVRAFTETGRVLKEEGRIVSVVSSPEIYRHEWASFTTRDYPENNQAKSGDPVKITIKDVEDQRPVVDILWTEADYQAVYQKAGLEVVKVHKPLAKVEEPYPWINETRIPPWVIYVLKPQTLEGVHPA